MRARIHYLQMFSEGRHTRWIDIRLAESFGIL